MKAFFDINEGRVVEATQEAHRIAVYTKPVPGEMEELIRTLNVARHDIESALDPEEIARVEFGADNPYIIWKCPKNVSIEEQIRFRVSSVGLFWAEDRLTLVSSECIPEFTKKEFDRTTSLTDFVLRFFLRTVRHYLDHLRAIKALSVEIEAKLNAAMENRYLLQMFALSEGLIYYLNDIEANNSLLARLNHDSRRLGFSEHDLALLDDIIIESQQCSKQTSIYTTVLSGLMDARGNIINNNMNALLKNLRLINVVFLPLNLIAGIGGMSEFSMMTSGIDWRISFSLFLCTMMTFGWVMWIVLVRKLNSMVRADGRS